MHKTDIWVFQNSYAKLHLIFTSSFTAKGNIVRALHEPPKQCLWNVPCMKRLLSVDEAKEICWDRNKWNKLVSAYPCGKKTWRYVCLCMRSNSMVFLRFPVRTGLAWAKSFHSKRELVSSNGTYIGWDEPVKRCTLGPASDSNWNRRSHNPDTLLAAPDGILHKL